MSTESDALMQQFRQTVYDRPAVHSLTGLSFSPLECIGQRANKFAHWRITVRQDKEPDTLAPDFLRHWVLADVTAFRQIHSAGQYIAADDIFLNISTCDAYAQMLRSVGSDVFERIKAIQAEHAKAREKLLDDTQETREWLELALPSDWNGKVAVKPGKHRVLGDVYELWALRDGGKSPTYLAFMDTRAQAETLASRFDPISKRWLAPQNSEQAVNGFGSGITADDKTEESKPADPEPLISKLLESVTYQMQQDGSVLYRVHDRSAFVDHGQQILLAAQADEDEEAILAAILLAKEKYGGAFELTGSEAFKRRAIEIMLQYQVKARLKNPQQHALRHELAKEGGTANANSKPEAKPTSDAEPEKTVIGWPASEAATLHDIAAATHESSKSAETTLRADAGMAEFRAQFEQAKQVEAGKQQAREAFQRFKAEQEQKRQAAEHQRQEAETKRQAEIERRQQPKKEPPGSVLGANCKLHECTAMISTEPHIERAHINLKEPSMVVTQNANDPSQDPKPILRGVKKRDNGEFDTTVLLFKGKGDDLQGYVKIGDQKHQVLAHLNERKPNKETGEMRPNFIKLSELHGDGDESKWQEIGFGNAVNHRKDGKPVYFDEVLLSVGNEVVKACITKHVDDELHRKLGFQKARETRPKDVNKNTVAEEARPKLTAPAAKAQEDAAGAPAKVRHSLRAKA